MARSRLLSLLFFYVFFMILVGCQSESSVEQIVPKAESNKATQFEQTPLSLADNEFGFERSHGWLDEETILYSASKGQASQLFSYHVPTGRKVLLYTLEGAMSEVSISPEKEYILTSSANGDNMEFRILSSAGKQVFSFAVQAMEISFSWNEFQEGLLLVESFDEDWLFTSYIVNIPEEQIQKLRLPQPFAQWASESQLLYMDWDQETPGSPASLKLYDMEQETAVRILDQVISFYAHQDVLMTVTDAQDEDDKIKYVFSDWQGKRLNEWKVPVIGSAADWNSYPFSLIPNTQSLVTFIPDAGPETDEYTDSYNLVEYNWVTGDMTTLKENVDAAPIVCSPDGRNCLYGYSLENIWNVKK